MMNAQIDDMLSELEKISGDANKTFANLRAEQINWRPPGEGWSVGQCFEHMIKTNSLFFPVLEQIERGEYRNSFWQNYSPLSSFFGNLLIKSLQKDERKFKAPTEKIVPPSEIDARVVETFSAHQREMIDRLRRAAGGKADWQKTVITSPFMKLMTYKLSDGVRIVVEHEKRHVRQAERVMREAGFPK